MKVIREIIIAIREYMRSYREINQGCLNFRVICPLDMYNINVFVHMWNTLLELRLN